MKRMIQFCVLLGMAIGINAAQDLAPKYLSLIKNPQELLSISVDELYAPGVHKALQMGANPNNVYSFDGATVLRYAMRHLHYRDSYLDMPEADWLRKQENAKSIVFMLLDGGADPNQLNNNDTEPPLMSLFSFNDKISFFMYHEQVVEKLLQKGAHPHQEDRYGNTPLRLLTKYYVGLHGAESKKFDAKMIKLLMRYGADPYNKPYAVDFARALIAQIKKDFEQEQLANQTLHFLADQETQRIQEGHAFPPGMQIMISFMLRRNEIKTVCAKTFGYKKHAREL